MTDSKAKTAKDGETNFQLPFGKRDDYLKTIMDSVQAGIVIIDVETRRIADANPAALQMIGAARDDVIGSICHQFICPAAQGQCPICDLGQSVDNSERVLLTAQGNVTPIIKNVVTTTLEGREYLVESFVSIAEQKRTEDELRGLSRAVEQSASTVVITDTKGYIEYVNPRFSETTGYTQEEAIGQHTRVLKSGEMPPEEYKKLWETIAAGRTWRGEFHNRKKNGDFYWESAIISPIKNEAEQITHFLAVKEEITERKQLEEMMLVEDRSLLRVMMDNLPDYIYVKDRQGKFLLVNAALARLMGEETPDELVGKSDFDFYSHELAFQYRADELSIIESGQALIDHEEINADHKTEEQIWTSTTKVPFTDNQGQILGLVGVSRDITDRKRFEDTLAKQAVELETVAQVSIAASTILETDKLLQEVVDLTKERFNLYHAHIYLLDDITNKLNLSAGAGDIGRKMTARGWSIPLDRERSLVARAARTRKGIIANDVRQEPDFFPNPLLPNTRSELAVPLIAGDMVLGVLDVLADKVDHFTDQDARIQSTLAAQVAVALQNARLFAEQEKTSLMLQERVKGLNLLNEIGRETDDIPPIPQFLQWVTERVPPIMQYADLCVAAIEFDGQVYGQAKAIDLPSQIAYGLYIGGQLEGRLYTAYTEKREFINEESAMLSAVATRVSGYIENRRLLGQTETALEEANLLRRAVEQSLDGSAVADMDGHILFANLAWAKMHGYDTKEELLGEPLSIFHTEEQLQNEVATFNAQVMQQGAHQGEVGHKRKDGTTFPTWMTVAVLLDAEGNPTGLAAAAQDITERKQMEETIRANEALYQSLLDAIPQNLYRVDREGRVVFGNEAYLDLMGMSLEEMIGKTTYDLASKEMADKYTADDRRVMQSGEVFEEVELHKERTSGKTTYVQTVKSPVRDLSGQIIGIQGIFWDITEQREAAIERERLLTEVEDAYRQYVRQEWSQFLGEQQQEVLRIEVQSPGGGNGAAIEAPIILRGQAIGSLKLQDTAPERAWSEDEKALVDAVSEQLALTMENLRLFEDTQQRATREQLTRQITDKMRAAPDIDSIIESGLSALAGALNVPRAYVKLTPEIKGDE